MGEWKGPPPYVFLGGGPGDWKGPAVCIFGRAFPPKKRGLRYAARSPQPSLDETGSHVGSVKCEIVFVWLGEVRRGSATVMPSVEER